jgi:hypothetical protein
MSDKVISGPYTIGQGKAIPVDHAGPLSYTTGGETYGNINNQTGISTLGLGTLDFVDPIGPTLSGNFYVYAQATGTGSRKTFKLIWVTATAGIPSSTQVAAAVNLSAETVRMLVVGR